MRSIKRALDPYWLMNPGKVFEPVGDQVPQDVMQLAAAPNLQEH